MSTGLGGVNDVYIKIIAFQSYDIVPDDAEKKYCQNVSAIQTLCSKCNRKVKLLIHFNIDFYSVEVSQFFLTISINIVEVSI